MDQAQFTQTPLTGARLELGGSGDVGEGGAEEGGEGAKEGEEGKGVVKPKRVIKNPQPKLNPDRITGQRGVIQLEKVFKDFKPKGMIFFMIYFLLIT